MSSDDQPVQAGRLPLKSLMTPHSQTAHVVPAAWTGDEESDQDRMLGAVPVGERHADAFPSYRHSAEDRARVAELLGRAPNGDFEVVVRDAGGDPVVIRNAPLLRDGRPMPTLYWLVGLEARRRVGRLEAQGGVRAAEAAVDAAELVNAHIRYAAERDAEVPAGHNGPVPSGGVGGTRRGVKCLHAHYAWYLAGGDDPVGRWVSLHLTQPLHMGTPSAGPKGCAG